MSIKSTCEISRESAIERIIEINDLIKEKKYRTLESVTSEDSYYDLQDWVDSYPLKDISDIGEWTNKMLEDQMDEPFFRMSMFYNYLIE